MLQIRNVFSVRNELGECPLWNPVEKSLFWVDIDQKTLSIAKPDAEQVHTYRFPHRIGCFGFCNNGELILATEAGLGFWKVPGIAEMSDANDCLQAIAYFSAVSGGIPGTRFNDGKVDRRGRFWVGTKSDCCLGMLYRVDPDLTVHPLVKNLTISNGIGWSPDNKLLYLADTLRQVVYAYPFNLEMGILGIPEVFIRIKPDDGYPDGLTIDAEGCLWLALWGGKKIQRYDPRGNLILEIPMPVSQPTSLTFGNERLDTIYISSAWSELDAAQREADPLAGDVFCITPGVSGIAEPFFRRIIE